MMVTIVQGEQGASIALSSHSGPPLIYSDLRRPGQRDGRIHISTCWETDRGETLLYDIRYSRLYDIKGPIITRGKSVLCMIGRWLFHRKKIPDHVWPICSIVIMARLITLIRDYMITVRCMFNLCCFS